MNAIGRLPVMFAMVTLLASPALAQSGSLDPSGATALAGRGALSLSVQGADGAGQRVSVNVAPDGAVPGATGTATVFGFPVILSGNFGVVDWKLSGRSVSGRLVDPQGNTLGTFEGTISLTGLSGKYTTADGRTGLWSWDGTVPKVTEATVQE